MKTKIIIDDTKTQFSIHPFNHLKITVINNNIPNSIVTINFIDRLGKIAYSKSFQEIGIVFNEVIGEYIRFRNYKLFGILNIFYNI